MKVVAAKITLELGKEEMSVFPDIFGQTWTLATTGWSNMNFSNYW